MRIELLIAQTILQGFDAQYGRFLVVTAGAQQRFEQADWPAVQAAIAKGRPLIAGFGTRAEFKPVAKARA